MPRRKLLQPLVLRELCCILVSIISFLNATKLAETTDLHIGLLISNLNNRPNNSHHNVYEIVGKDDKILSLALSTYVNLNAHKKELQNVLGIKKLTS